MAPDSVGGETVAVELKRSLRHLIWATVILYCMTIFLVVVGFLYISDIVDDNVRNATQTNEALCAVRNALQGNIEQESLYLDSSPDISHPTRLFLEERIENNQAVVDAMNDLDCPQVGN